MSTLRTIPQLVADFRAEQLNSDSIRHILEKAKLKPRAEVPYGRGQARFYDKDEAYEAIRKFLAERKPPAKGKADDHTVSGATSDIKYLVGLIEEQQEVIKKILAGQQMLFKHVEGIAHQVNALVVEWRGEAAKGAASANGVDIDAAHRRAS